MASTVPAAGSASGCGHHVCALADEPQALARMASEWVGDGLRAGERVLWAEPPGGGLIDWLYEHGVPWQEPLEHGQLLLVTPDELLGLDSADDIPLRLADADQQVRRAVADGYAGLRVGAEVAVALTVMPDVETQLRFEAAWEDFTCSHAMSFMCVYEPESYGSQLAQALEAHPRGLADRQAAAEVAAGVVRLRGEVDLFNVDRLSGFIEAALDGGPWLLDLSALTFIDVRGAARLVELSRARPPERRLRVASPPFQLRRIVELMGWQDDVEFVGSATP